MADEPRMTPRMQQLIGDMLRGKPGAYRSGPDISNHTGIPASTVPSLLWQMVHAGWAETEVKGRSRKFRLVPAGIEALRAKVLAAANVPDPDMAATRSTAELRQFIKRTAGDIGETDGGQLWTMARLKDRDPALARLVAAKMAEGKYVDS